MEGFASLTSQKMISYILNLIRYDLPFLLVGSSSIGKSFTIVAIAEKYRVPYSLLFLGSEKSDNIEGLPKLTGLSSEDDTVKYLKPYWFPKSELIESRIKSGVAVFEKLNKEIYNGSFPFTFKELSYVFEILGNTNFVGNSKDVECTINNKKFKFKREIAQSVESLFLENELDSLCLLLSTITGMGNHFLIIDELDKVSEIDSEKFAPMLHVVRERKLKGYNMREFNSNEGADIASHGDYRKVYSKILDAINLNLSLVDTRVIAIGNQSENINEISDALFKRFIQVIVTDILILKEVPEDVAFIKNCLTENFKQMVVAPVDFAFLDEVNLQWLFGFLPRITNSTDEGNFFREDFLQTLSANRDSIANLSKDQVWDDTITTAMHKLVQDNFNDPELQKHLLHCIYKKLTHQGEQKKNNQYFDGGIANEELMSISEKKKLGFNAKQVADDIFGDLMNEYTEVVLLSKDTSRVYELDRLIRKSAQFMRASLGLEATIIWESLEENSHPDLINYLLPKYLRFAYMIVLNDDVISSDDTINLLSTVSLLLQNLKSDIKNKITEISNFVGSAGGKIEIVGSNVEISTDFEETKKLLYAPENSFYGTDKTPLEIDKFKNSFTFKFAERTNFSAKIEFITKIINGEITKDEFSKTIINMLVIVNYDEIFGYFKGKSLAFLKEKKMEDYKKYSELAKKFESLRVEVDKNLKR